MSNEQIDWEGAKASAADGTLFLDPEIGRQFIALFNTYIHDGPDAAMDHLSRAKQMSGFAYYRTTTALRQAIEHKASGTSDSMDMRLLDVSAQAKELVDLISKSVANYESTDATERDRITKEAEGLP